MARAGGRIERGGDRALAEAAAEALAAPAGPRGDDVAASFTHGLHTYPARMHPATARVLIQALARGPGGARAAVLDPFCGSGTTLVEARAAGLFALGTDLNPLAVAIARTKTWTAPRARIRQLTEIGAAIAAEALAEGKAARRAGHRAAPLRRVGPDPAGRDRALSEWFPPHVRRELESLAALIDETGEDEAELATLLRVVLSSILYKVSLRASDTDPRRVTRQVARGAAARLFGARIELLGAGLEQLARAASGPMPRCEVGDARRLGRLAPPGRTDVVVTSPPYAGTYDYAAVHGLRMLFLGFDPRGLERGEIGARTRFRGDPGRRTQALGDTVRDMGAVLGEVARALSPGGVAALVVGDSLAGRGAVRADRMVANALEGARLGGVLDRVAWAWQERATLGAAERAAFGGGPPKREHVIILARR